MKKGTIVLNRWEWNENPLRYFIYAGNENGEAIGLSYFNGKLIKQLCDKKRLQNKEIFEPIGHCNAFDIMREDLKRIMDQEG